MSAAQQQPTSEYLKQSSQLHNTSRPQVAILDFGSQYSHLIARRVRELHVYCELYSCLVSADELKRHELTAVILSGGPNSVYEEGAPHVEEGVWELIKERKVPVLGICYGMQVRKCWKKRMNGGEVKVISGMRNEWMKESHLWGNRLTRGVTEVEKWWKKKRMNGAKF